MSGYECLKFKKLSLLILQFCLFRFQNLQQNGFISMVDDFLNISNANSELSVNGDSFEYSYMFLRIVAVSIFILGNTQQTLG